MTTKVQKDHNKYHFTLRMYFTTTVYNFMLQTEFGFLNTLTQRSTLLTKKKTLVVEMNPYFM